LQHLQENLNKLDLSEDQKAKIAELLKSTKQQMEDIRNQVQAKTLERPAARDKVTAILADQREKMMNILTPEQQQKIKELMQNAPDGAAPRGGPGANRRKDDGQTGGPATRPGAAVPAPAAVASVVPSPPGAGQNAPEFNLKKLDGESVGLSSFRNKLLVLVFGCYTEPTFRDHAADLESLRDQYGSSGVSFLVVYTKESHPTGGWEVQRNKAADIAIAQPTSEAERITLARRTQSELKLSIPIAPDTMDDKAAGAYAVAEGRPAYVIDRGGKIVFRQSWLEPHALGRAISDAMAMK
jgi:Spy/CpxP family protein refolding chaperone